MPLPFPFVPFVPFVSTKRHPSARKKLERPPSRTALPLQTDVGTGWVHVDNSSPPLQLADNDSTISQEPNSPRIFEPGKVIRRLTDRLKPSRKKSRVISSSNPSTIKIATENNTQTQENSTKSLYWKAFQERNVFIGLRRDYASQRTLLKELLEKAVCHDASSHRSLEPSSSQEEPNAGDLYQVWPDILKIMAFLNDLEADLDISNERLTAIEKKLDAKHINNVSSASSVLSPGDSIENSAGSESDHDSSSTDRAPIVRDYYRQVGNMGFLSDELLALGPRPKRFASHAAADDHADRPSSIPEDFTPEEYAERHLQLVTDLKLAEVEAVRLKALCLAGGHELEEMIVSEDDNYREAVEALTTGPPIIDSMLIMNEIKASPATLAVGDSARTEQGGGIENWVADVRSASTKLSSSTVENHDAESTALDTELHSISTPADRTSEGSWT